MDEQRAREILGNVVTVSGSLSCSYPYVCWSGPSDEDGPDDSYGRLTLDGDFDPSTLQAIAWWVVNVKVAK